MSLDQLYLLPPDEQSAILEGPAMLPPDGILDRNFDDPPNDNSRALAIIIVCFGLMTIGSFLRAYSRICIVRSVFLEDYIAAMGYILVVAFAGCCLRLMTNTGYFVHQYDVRVQDLSKAFYVFHLASAFYAVILICMKSAILLEWARIFGVGGPRGLFKITCHIVIGLNVIMYSSSFIVVNLSCKPYSKIWDPTVPGWCMQDKQIMDVITGGLNIGSHLVIFFLPQRVIWKLQLSTKKKLGVSLIFAVGLMALASSAIRLYVSVEFIRAEDKIYWLGILALWVFAELTCIFLVFCIPAIPKIITEKKLISRIGSRLQLRSHGTAEATGHQAGSTSTDNLYRSGSAINDYKQLGENSIALRSVNV